MLPDRNYYDLFPQSLIDIIIQVCFVLVRFNLHPDNR